MESVVFIYTIPYFPFFMKHILCFMRLCILFFSFSLALCWGGYFDHKNGISSCPRWRKDGDGINDELYDSVMSD